MYRPKVAASGVHVFTPPTGAPSVGSCSSTLQVRAVPLLVDRTLTSKLFGCARDFHFFGGFIAVSRSRNSVANAGARLPRTAGTRESPGCETPAGVAPSAPPGLVGGLGVWDTG